MIKSNSTDTLSRAGQAHRSSTYLGRCEYDDGLREASQSAATQCMRQGQVRSVFRKVQFTQQLHNLL